LALFGAGSRNCTVVAMGWDDSDDESWDDADLEAKLEQQLKEKERARRREQGLDSESEEEDAPAPAAPPPKPKAKPKAKVEAAPKVEEPVLTAEERKLRQRRIEEEQADRLIGDTFGGFEAGPSLEEERKRKEAQAAEARRKVEAAKSKLNIIDAFDSVKLHKQADVEKLCNTCATKISKGTLKGGSNFFLKVILKSFEDVITVDELEELDKNLETIVKEKKAAQGAVAAKDNKANTKCSKTTKFNAASEWEEVYGGGEDDEDWTQEEWDEWNRQQAAAHGYAG